MQEADNRAGKNRDGTLFPICQTNKESRFEDSGSRKTGR